MKKLYILLTIVMAATVAQANVKIDYTIKKGETLSVIAKKYHTTVAHIQAENGLSNTKALVPGKRLKITMNTYSPKKIKYHTALHNTHTLADIKKKRHLAKKTHTLKDIKEKYNKSKTSTKIAKADSQKTIKKNTVKKPRKVKIAQKKSSIVKKTKKRHSLVKAKIHKSVTKNKTILTALKKHGKPFVRKKKKVQQRVTVDDILFKSSKRHNAKYQKSNGTKANKIINIAKTKLGRRYVWGATGQRGTFDCSGFTSYVYKKNGIHIPRTSRNQAKYGKYVSRNNLKKGDLIFFDTSKRRKGYVNHVGIYLGNGKFIHASSAKKKVVVSSLSKFYAQRYVGARRPS